MSTYQSLSVGQKGKKIFKCHRRISKECIPQIDQVPTKMNQMANKYNDNNREFNWTALLPSPVLECVVLGFGSAPVQFLSIKGHVFITLGHPSIMHKYA
jgi:hypothetical protein